MNAGVIGDRSAPSDYGVALIAAPLRLLHGFLSIPVLAYLAALTAMLFRPPDLKSFPVDRVAFIALLACIGLRICLRHGLRHEGLRSYPATWPLLGLLLLGVSNALTQPYDPQTWSLLAAKWIVPFAMFHVAGIVFSKEESLRKLEVFSLTVFVYLTAIAVFDLAGAKSLTFPRFILDEGIGIHADRARGPFLQAVANGLCLNLLGLIAFDSLRRKRLRGTLAVALLFAAPLALLATRTRAVWLSAAFSVGFLALCGLDRRVRRAAIALCAFVVLGMSAAVIYKSTSDSFSERLEERSPVDFRVVMYRTGWQMFTEKPLTGWSGGQNLQAEIGSRVWDFHPDYYVFHNTYLELAVEHGLVGLGLYAWLMFRLFQLRRPIAPAQEEPHFIDASFRKLWPLMLGVYLFNASAVVMNYQFVNGFLFTIAGILASQNIAQRGNPLRPERGVES